MISKNVNSKKMLNNLLFYCSIGIFMVFIVFPFFWQFMTSIKPMDELYLMPPIWIPSKINLEFYYSVFFKRPFLIYLKNSAIVAGSSTLFAVFVASFAAYALARLNFRGKNLILSMVLAVSMFPGIAIVSSLFIMLRQVGLLNSYLGLIITYITITMPLSVWILTTFFKEIPTSLEEAAKVDGASPLKTFFLIIFPLAAPGLFTTAILVFISSWNEFLYSLVFNTKDTMRTVPVGIAMFPGDYNYPWGDIAAASVVVTVPLILLVLLFQKRIISGLTAGAVKG